MSNNRLKMRQITLMVPHLLENTPPSWKKFTAAYAFPNFRAILSQGHKRQIDHRGYGACLADVFDFQSGQPLPVAALHALADGLNGQEGFWLQADPVFFHVDQATVYLSAVLTGQLSQTETESLISSINDLIGPDDMSIRPGPSNHWYLQLDRPPQIKTIPPSLLIGKSISGCLPTGENGARWRKLLTELQMLLFQHPVNQLRAESRSQLISGLWFWGEGALTTPAHRPFDQIYSASPLCKGLGQYLGIPTHSLPVSFNHFIQENSADNALVAFDTLPSPHLPHRNEQGPEQQWYQQMQLFDQDWLKPLLSAFKKKQLEKCVIYPGKSQVYTLGSTSLSCWWWKRNKKIDHFL